MAAAPTIGRPARGLSTERANKWVLASAVITGMIYAFRRLIEPSVSSAPAKGGKGAQLLGAGSPPPALGQWVVAYGVGHIMLAVLALGAPEVAASLAMLVIAGELLTNGLSVVADIAGLEGKTPSAGSTTLSAEQVRSLANTAAAAGTAPGGANAGLVHGAGTRIP